MPLSFNKSKTSDKVRQKLKLLLVSLVSAMASAALAEERILTVKETLGGIFVGGELATAVAKIANPAAKPILYELLDKPRMKEHRGRIYLLFRYIGDKGDAANMQKRLQAGAVDWVEIEKVMSALVTMETRGVSEAGAILERMTQPQYWHDTKFAAMTNSPIGMTNELAIWSIFAYARSGKPDWEIKVRSSKEKARAPKLRTELEWRLDPIRIKQHLQEDRALKVPPITPEFRKLLSQFFNGDMNNPGPATQIDMPPRQPGEEEVEATVLKTLSPQELGPLKAQALKAFNVILDAFVNDRYEQLALTLAESGRPLVPVSQKEGNSLRRALERLKHLSREGHLNRTKEFIKEINPQAATHGEVKGEQLSDGTLVVRIPCLGSEAVRNKYFPEMPIEEFTPTVDQDGRFNIYMLKQDNHWYWNPFGW